MYSLLLVLGLSFISAIGHSAEIITAGDGKKFQLNDDGTWAVVSQDRVLDTPDGRRVVLKVDGTWELLGLAPSVNNTKFQNLMLSASIKGIAIDEIRETIRAGKNTRTQSQTRVSLELTLASTAEASIDLTALKPADFVVEDNIGRGYRLVALESDLPVLDPGMSVELVLVSDKGPKGLAKIVEYIVILPAGTLTNTEDITLTYDYDRVARSRVLK
jgi:hypothetical protein